MSDLAPAPHTHRVTLLIAVAGVLVAGYALWRVDNTRDREDATRDRVQQLETANTALRSELAGTIAGETKMRAELQKQWQQVADLPQQVKDLAAAHDDLRARTERPQRAWSRAEALYLIDLAQRRLSFDHDTATAIAALESADAQLASLRDASLTGVRERLAKDLQALRAVPEPDRTGVVARLTAIEDRIEHLPLKGILVGQRVATESTAEPQSMFARVWKSITETLASMFVVRHLRDDNGSVVSLEEQSLRRQHLALLTFAARHAVLRNNQAAYQAALDEMHRWIAQFFGESTSVDALMQELDALRKIDIAPPLPDLSSSAELLARVSASPSTP
jgi:uroporphyrin-3 C-methyltransferase